MNKINSAKLKLTIEEIDAARTAKGGFSKETLAGWGIDWPPPHGWKKALLDGVEAEPKPEPQSFPDSIESDLLHDVVMAIIDSGNGHVLAGIENANKYYRCDIPTVADIVGGRPAAAIIEGGITWDDKVYRFSVARIIKPPAE